MAAPMAGTCEVKTEAVILAMWLLSQNNWDLKQLGSDPN
jgi:hypothetical protein